MYMTFQLSSTDLLPCRQSVRISPKERQTHKRKGKHTAVQNQSNRNKRCNERSRCCSRARLGAFCKIKKQKTILCFLKKCVCENEILLSSSVGHIVKMFKAALRTLCVCVWCR